MIEIKWQAERRMINIQIEMQIFDEDGILWNKVIKAEHIKWLTAVFFLTMRFCFLTGILKEI